MAINKGERPAIDIPTRCTTLSLPSDGGSQSVGRDLTMSRRLPSAYTQHYSTAFDVPARQMEMELLLMMNGTARPLREWWRFLPCQGREVSM